MTDTQQLQRLFEQGRYFEAQALLSTYRDDPVATLNIAILHDRLRDPNGALGLLPVLLNIEEASGQYWHTLTCLSHKLNRFEESAMCARRAIALLEPGTQLSLDASIKLGYDLEGLGHFKEAIKVFEELLHTSGMQLDLFGLTPEIKHGLGHFYTELAGVTGSYKDVRLGRQYMGEAAAEQAMYLTCYGTIHCEAREYEKGVRILQDALEHADVASNEHLRNEILFYTADALSWLGRTREANALFSEFETYATGYRHPDGIAHSKLYQTASFLRTLPLLQMEESELVYHLRLLEEHAPSLYATASFHEYWGRLRTVLTFLLGLQHAAAGKLSLAESVDLIKTGLRACRDRPLLLVLTDDPGTLSHGLCSGIVPQVEARVCVQGVTSELIAPRTGYGAGVVLAAWGNSVLTEHAVLLTSIPDCLCIHIDLGAPVPDVLRSRLYSVADPEQALREAELLLLFDKIRWELTQPFFLFGLTPTYAAPTFSAQSGELDLLFEMAEHAR